MKKSARAMTVLAFALFAPGAGAQKLNMQEGLWDISVKMDMPGMPTGAGTQTFRQCYTASDVADASRTLPKDDNCQVSDLKIQGNTVSWTLRCKPPREMSGTGTMTYQGASYAGTMKFSMKQDGQVMNINQQIAGKRVGPCK